MSWYVCFSVDALDVRSRSLGTVDALMACAWLRSHNDAGLPVLAPANRSLAEIPQVYLHGVTPADCATRVTVLDCRQMKN